MPDNSMNCEAIQLATRQGRELTAFECDHLDECEACMEVWLTSALEAKPEVTIPADFATRVAANMPVRPTRRSFSRKHRHWGLGSAVAMVAVMLAACFAGPNPANSWVGVVFVSLVATEIAGLALWLGPKWTRL